jgi:hypothetical protein
MTRDIFELTPKDRGILEVAFNSEIPDLRVGGTMKSMVQETPEQAFEIQVKSALERTSGRNRPDCKRTCSRKSQPRGSRRVATGP